MARILTGVQSTGTPHLGNLLGAILPGVALSKDPKNECFFFIADFHSLTAIKDPDVLSENTYAVAAAWLACGFDTNNGYFYRQSDIPEVTELAWYLNCFTPYPMLNNAVSFKDKSANKEMHKVNAGLFMYPVLQAADIMLYDADIVPVGKDQQQHLEMTRDIGGAFNRAYGETLVIPEAQIRKDTMLVPGTDGRKMSKSYGNYINIFEQDKALKKQVMNIVTDSTPLEDPKDPDTCNVFAIYQLLADEGSVTEMRENYRKGGYGYGHAKKALLELIKERFATERETFWHYMANKNELDEKLKEGAEKAGIVAFEVLSRVRDKIGYKKFVY